MEIALSSRKYTWSNNHEDPTFELLDRVLVSPAWEEKYPLVAVKTLNRELSDHTPLLINTGEKPRHPATFRFENCWLLRPELKDMVKNEWSKNVYGKSLEDIWHQKMKNMSNASKARKKTLKGRIKN